VEKIIPNLSRETIYYGSDYNPSLITGKFIKLREQGL
jgi:hypothetical protein